jgi:photosystem II stability/assembly factor-like uncharacterized protein
MKADLSRNTFDRTQHYSAVRLQQGRIVTDADWNEQSDIARYRVERAARDTIGPCGAPLDAAGYGLVAETNTLAVLAVNANVVWIVAEDGALLESTNGGADWTLVDTASSADLRAIAIAGSAGWLVGDGGSVRKTNNRGLTWSAQNAGTFAALRGVAAVDGNHAWAVGDGGIVVSTIDGGLTWGLAQTSAARLYAVNFYSASSGLAVGQGGAIVETNDGGQTWNTVASGSRAHLHALARVGTTHWWAAGSGGTILRSDDGGATWFPGATPSAATLYAIAFRDDFEGWAAGEGGTLLHSTDGGATWKQENAGFQSSALRSLSIFGTEPGWAVGDGGAALRVGIGSPDVADLRLPAVNLSIEPGRYYVNGMLCELENRVSYAHQADGGAGKRLAPGAYMVYLKAWQRHVSALEAPAIREVALGGPDTATRARTIAQVRALPLALESPFEWNCDSSIAAWDALIQVRRPRLAARSEPQLAAANLCEIAATAGYRHLENQLYRVEVHDGGASPTFKWSRENGSVAFAVVSVAVNVATQQTTVRVASRGRDANLDIAVHDRVELIDDDAELTHRAGSLFEFLSDGEDKLELVLSGLPYGSLGHDPTKHPVLRRWDQKPTAAGANTLPVALDTWIDLEDGVQVRFEADGVWRPGDYWQIPARTITADVEWPRDDDGDPIASEPAGITDAYCRLGIVEVDGDGEVSAASDCREFFAPLTQMEQLLYVSGDGQDAAPNAMLPQPLALRVARGTVPIARAGVLFEVGTGGGRIGPGFGASFWQFQATTDANGLAECRWTLGPAAGAPGRFQRVSASLLDADGQPVPGQVLVYCATATMLLQTLGGDGQQASAGGTLANAIAFRVTNGADGVAGVVLTATVDEGGGAVVGASSLTTDPNGYASVAWQLGAGGAQRLTVRLVDAQGNELQRLTYTASIAQAGSSGACVTIGPGGQFPQLDSNLLAQLLSENGGAACICFMPGTHQIADLVLEGRNPLAQLAIHGCGLATSLSISGKIVITGLGSLEVKDLSIDPTQTSMVLQSIGELRLSGLVMNRTTTQIASPLLVVSGVRRVRMTGCKIGIAARASAIFENIATECHLDGNLFLGPLSFYGLPGSDPSAALISRFGDGQRAQLNAQGSLHLTDNNLQLLTIGEGVATQLEQQATANGIFQSAVIEGNTFNVVSNVFVSSLLSFTGNTFLAPAAAGAVLSYGVMLVTRAAAAGNVAETVGQQAVLRFLIPGNGGFNGAANQVFTAPTSTP